MRVLLPAAGIGSRLGGSGPKILTEVGGRTILQRHLDSLDRLGVSPGSVTVVTGFCREILERACRDTGITFIFNPCWRFPGTLGSFFVLPPSDRDLLVIHGDLLWEPGLISEIMNKKGDVVLPVDPAAREDLEGMKAETRGSSLLHLSKTLPSERSSGESMGVFLIRRHRELHRIVEPLVHKPRCALDDGINLAAGRMNIRVHFSCSKRWEEVDTPQDLQRAREVFCGTW